MTERKRALIIGCGRMGAGRDHTSPWVYTHPEAYRATDRVEIVGFVDRVLARAKWAAETWNVDFYGDHVTAALKTLQPDIVSICTPPSDRAEILEACYAAGTRGIWCEKPFNLDRGFLNGTLIQVNYIRRFDRRHRAVRERLAAADQGNASLFVISANDIHTTCHFTDLARWWGVKQENFHYRPFHGPSLYILREPGEVPGRYSGWSDEAFVGGGVETGFMEAALKNLLDAMDSKAGLSSPACRELVETEARAYTIIANGGANR